MPNFSAHSCRKTYEDENQDCGGVCYTDSCPLIPQPVKLSALNELIYDLYIKKEAVGWDGIDAIGSNSIKVTLEEREYIYRAMSLIKAYHSILELPESEQNKHMTDLLNG